MVGTASNCSLMKSLIFWFAGVVVGVVPVGVAVVVGLFKLTCKGPKTLRLHRSSLVYGK